MQATIFMEDCDGSSECHSALRHFCGWLVSKSGSNEQLKAFAQPVVGGKSKGSAFWGVLHDIREPKFGTKSRRFGACNAIHTSNCQLEIDVPSGGKRDRHKRTG